MNTSYYLEGFMRETRLVERSSARVKDKSFLGHLDEAIFAALRMLRDQRRPYEDVLKGPGKCLKRKLPPCLEMAWIARARDTLKLVERYKATKDPAQRTSLRFKLSERHVQLPREESHGVDSVKAAVGGTTGHDYGV